MRIVAAHVRHAVEELGGIRRRHLAAHVRRGGVGAEEAQRNVGVGILVDAADVDRVGRLVVGAQPPRRVGVGRLQGRHARPRVSLEAIARRERARLVAAVARAHLHALRLLRLLRRKRILQVHKRLIAGMRRGLQRASVGEGLVRRHRALAVEAHLHPRPPAAAAAAVARVQRTRGRRVVIEQRADWLRERVAVRVPMVVAAEAVHVEEVRHDLPRRGAARRLRVGVHGVGKTAVVGEHCDFHVPRVLGAVPDVHLQRRARAVGEADVGVGGAVRAHEARGARGVDVARNGRGDADACLLGKSQTDAAGRT